MLLPIVVLLTALSATAFGQKLMVEIDTEEGQLLQEIDKEQDQANKLRMLETFAKRFPNHEAVTWVLSNMQQHYLASKQFDRVF